MAEFNDPVASRHSRVVGFTPPDIARQRAIEWDGLRVESIRITRRERFEYELTAPRHLLIAAERAERRDGETLVEGLPMSTLRKFSGRLSFIPAGHRFYGWQDPQILTRVTYFYIDPHASLFNAEGSFAATEFKPRLFFLNQDLWETASKLKAQAENPELAQRGYVNALSMVLAYELMRLNGDDASLGQAARGGLAGWQQRRLAEYIEAHVARDISLGELAGLARLSPSHFARAFKQSFGTPPHRYHMARRVERAKALLARPDLSVTTIGLEVGFSETSSFSAAFRKVTGITPTDFRRNLD